jgi:hypothetical protein
LFPGETQEVIIVGVDTVMKIVIALMAKKQKCSTTRMITDGDSSEDAKEDNTQEEEKDDEGKGRSALPMTTP